MTQIRRWRNNQKTDPVDFRQWVKIRRAVRGCPAGRVRSVALSPGTRVGREVGWGGATLTVGRPSDGLGGSTGMSRLKNRLRDVARHAKQRFAEVPP